MASIVTSGVAPGKLPHESGYVHGFVTLVPRPRWPHLPASLFRPRRGVEHAVIGEDPRWCMRSLRSYRGHLLGDEPE